MRRHDVISYHVPVVESLEDRLYLAIYSVPLTIPHDYSTDVTSQLQSFINSVPDGNTIAFPSITYDPAVSGYKVEGTLTISGRHNLFVEGNGAFIRAFDPLLDTNPNVRTRSQWSVAGSSSNITLQDFTIYGANTAHIYDATREAQHAFNVVGGANGVLINNVSIYETLGDGVYIGGSNLTQNVTVQNSHIQYVGRQGVSPCQGSNLLIQNNWIGNSSRGLIDIEPYASGWFVDNVRIIGNTLGTSHLLAIPMGGGGDYGLVYIANNVTVGTNGSPDIMYARSDAASRRGPFIVVNNRFNVGGSPAAGIRVWPVDGVFIAGNNMSFPVSRSMTAIQVTNSRGAVIVNNLFQGAAVGVSADASSLPLWQINNPLTQAGWSSQTVVTEFAGNPGCYYATAPDASGGQIIAIWRATSGTTPLTYGGLTTSGDYAVVHVDAGGAIVDGFGFNGASSYNAQDLAWLQPSAPTSLTATTISSSQINLRWTDTMANETGFRIERAPDVAGVPGTWATLASVAANVTTYSDSNALVPGSTYYYRVETVNAIADSAASNVASAAPTNVIPAAPSGLTATMISDGRINLSWTDNSNNETLFRIERSPTGTSGWTEIVTVAANVTAYSNTGLQANTTYYYRVRSYNAVGNSAYSSTASARTGAPIIPASPAGLAATALSPSEIVLNWTDNSDDESGFRIERAPSVGGVPGTWAEITTTAADTTTYDCTTGLAANTTYFFRVRAYNAAGNSAYSNVTSATTMQVAFAETWTGANGSSWPSTWTFETTGITTKDISGNTGRAVAPSGGSGIVYYNAANYMNSLQTVSLEGSLNGPKFGLVARRSDSAPTTYYGFQTDMIGSYSGSKNVYIVRYVNGTATTLATATLAANVTENVWYKLKFQVVQNGGSTDLSAKIWAASGAEPAAWTLQVSNNTAALQNVSGRDGLWLNPSSNRTIYADDYALTNLDPPAAPTAMTATAVSAGQVNLSWADNASNEAGYKIERSATGTSGWTQIFATAANATTYSDTAVLPTSTYYYRVYAYHSSANSVYSANASATTPEAIPAAPGGLAATAGSSSQISLSWNDNSNNEAGFSIERSDNGTTGWVAIDTVEPGVTTYDDDSLAPLTTHYYRVRAYNTGGNSTYSNTSSATTLEATPPTVLSAIVNGGGAKAPIASLDVQFSEAVVVAKADLQLYNCITHAAADLSGAIFSYNATTHTATWNLAGANLANDYYRATIPASVKDLAGNALDGNGNGVGGDGYSIEFTSLLGDMNADGLVNGFDINPFVLALTDPATYAAQYGLNKDIVGDIDGSGAMNGFDITPFVALLVGGAAPGQNTATASSDTQAAPAVTQQVAPVTQASANADQTAEPLAVALATTSPRQTGPQPLTKAPSLASPMPELTLTSVISPAGRKGRLVGHKSPAFLQTPLVAEPVVDALASAQSIQTS